MAEIVDPHVVARLAGTPLAARRPMLGHMPGRHQSPHRGSSVEFAEYRKYVPGDDTRRVDWRVYARSDRFYIKEFEADTNLRLCLILDTSGSMAFGSGPLTKWDYARRLAFTLAYLAIQQGDAAGLYASGPKLHCAIPPSRRPAHLKTIEEALQEMHPLAETGLTDHLHQLAEEIPQRALVILISDLLENPDKLIDCWQHLRFRQHDIAIFHLLDREELTLDLPRPYRFMDLEGGDSVLADPQVLRDRYARAVSRYQEAIRAGVAQCQVDYRQVVTDEDYEQVLARFLAQRLGILG